MDNSRFADTTNAPYIPVARYSSLATMAPQMSRKNPLTIYSGQVSEPMSAYITTYRRFHWSAIRLALALVMLSATPLSAASDTDAKPYDNKLYRLSEILGAVHYLRELCSAEDGMIWRDQMDALIKSEGTNAFRRVALIKQFNKGYRSYRRTYRTCTDSAKTAIDRFLTEGTKISDELVKKNW